MKPRKSFQIAAMKNWDSPQVQEEILKREEKESVLKNPNEIKLDEASQQLTMSFAKALTSLYSKSCSAKIYSGKIKTILDAFLLLNSNEKIQVKMYIDNYMRTQCKTNEFEEVTCPSPKVK